MVPTLFRAGSGKRRTSPLTHGQSAVYEYLDAPE